ncbi:response regulator [Rhodoferax sp.]|uniref:response regulator n=1 Tax=Rhodoferax sp. TaxID=50421 RepID=UPI001EBD52F9|nr:response regulator transcription factor [Rhodoferax sp.]MBT9505122.1 response regulator transcription factor [Rhodoferax sp.]
MDRKLLIVDDSALIQTALLGLFEGIQGIQSIDTASTLTQALNCVRRTLPNFVILDLNLPDGNGSAIITLLKEMVPGMLIAVLTNAACDFNRKKCLRAGADWFLDKSNEFEALLRIFQDLAAQNDIPRSMVP